MIGRPPRCLICHRTAHLILRDGPPICRPCVWEAVASARTIIDVGGTGAISLDELMRRIGAR